MSQAANATAQSSPSAGELLTPVLKELIAFANTHGGVWSGTAGELLSTLNPYLASSGHSWTEGVNALYDYIDRSRELLHNDGLEVEIRRGFPRVLCIRPCHDVKPRQSLPDDNSVAEPGVFSVVHNTDMGPLQAPQIRAKPPDPGHTSHKPDDAADETACTDDCSQQRPLFDSVPEILLALTHLDQEIGQRALCGSTALDVAAHRIAEVTKASGVAVSAMQHGSLLHITQIGANLGLELFLQPAMLEYLRRLGRPVHIAEVRNHVQLRSLCDHIESLTVAAIQTEKIEGIIQLGFAQRRFLGSADLTILKLITEIVAELMNTASS